MSVPPRLFRISGLRGGFMSVHENARYSTTLQLYELIKKDAQPLAARLLFDYRLCTTELDTIHKDWPPFADRTSVVA